LKILEKKYCFTAFNTLFCIPYKKLETKYLETKSLDSVGDTYTDGESIVTLDEPDGPLRMVSEIF